MMKIMSKTRMLLVVLVMAVLMTASMISASAANDPVVYSGTTQQEATTALQNAMATVESTGEDVVFTLQSNIFFDDLNTEDELATWITVGNAAESAGTLIIESEVDTDGKPLYGIKLDVGAVLHFKGNVTFRNIILDRDTTDGVSYYTGSYIFVTDGTGTFGEATGETYGNVVNPSSGSRASKVSLAGTDLKVYSGQYMAIGANFHSGVEVSNPTIVMGGNSKAEHVAGRGFYTYSESKVTGKSSLTIQDSATVLTSASGGYFKPSAKSESALAGDADFTIKDDANVKMICFVGNGTGGGSEIYLNKDEALTKSVYKVKLQGGKTSDVTSVYNMDGKASIKYVDLTVDIGAMSFTNYIYGGIYLTSQSSGLEFSNSDVTINLDGASLTSGFFGGSFFNPKDADEKATNNDGAPFIENVTRKINITNTTMGNLIVFGSRSGDSAAGDIVACDIQGSTTVTVTATTAAQKVSFDKASTFYLGSYLDAAKGKHSGDLTFNAEGVTHSTFVFAGQSATRYMGSYLRDSGTEHSALVNVTLYSTNDANRVQAYGGGQTIALCNVAANLTDVKIGGSSTISLKNFYPGSHLFGGSVLNSPVTNTGSAKLVLKDNVYPYSKQNVQFFGGDHVKFTGKNNDSTAKSEIVIETASTSNANLVYFGGSRIASAGTTYINSKLTYTMGATITQPLYGGSDITASGGDHAGSSAIETPGGWETSNYAITSEEIFGGSRLNVTGAKHSGKSEVATYQQSTYNTVIYGGSNLSIADGAIHSGASQVVSQTEKGAGYLQKNTYGGSKISTASTHSGTSAVIIPSGAAQSGAYIYGGSYLNHASAVHSGASKILVNGGQLQSGAAGVYGGSNIMVDGAKQTGTASFILEKGEVSCAHGAGSYTTLTLTDGNTEDLITSGFGQCADVFYTIKGGTISGRTNAAGYIANIDGDLYATISGGTFNTGLYLLGFELTNTVSVSGNSILKISGGTFTSNIVNGSSADKQTAGNNVINGLYYTELVNDGKGEDIVFAYVKSSDADTRTFVYLEPAGRTNQSNYVNSSMYVRFVGDIPMTDANGNKLVEWNFSSRMGYVPTSYIDYIQYTTTSNTSEMLSTGKFKNVYTPVNGVDVTLGGITLGTATLEQLSLTEDFTYTWNGKTLSYGELTAYDEYTDYPNTPCLVDSTDLNGISTSTTNVTLMIGVAKTSTTSALSSAAKAQLANVSTKYQIAGMSLRTGNLAMRCRAKISKEYFEADGRTPKAVNGFTVSKMGILVSLTDSIELTNENATLNAVAFENGRPNVMWASNAGDDDYYYFAAAITGYGNVGSLNGTRVAQNVYFRAYINLTNGETEITVYLDNPFTLDSDATNDTNNYGRSLEALANIIYTAGNDSSQSSTEEYKWYNDSENAINKETVGALLVAPIENYYTFSFNTGAELGSIKATPLLRDQYGTRYLVEITPNPGYVISTFALNGRSLSLNNNTLNVSVGRDSVVDVTYARKTSSELTTRRNKVISKMGQLTGVQFMVDKTYTYDKNGTTITLSPGTIYQGMPYTTHSSISPDAFLDFVKSKNSNGTYNMSFPIGSDPYYWGNSCGNAVYWAWSSISSTTSFTYSGNMTEKYGAYAVGWFDYDKSTDIDANGNWINTRAVLEKNGLANMAEKAYAFMAPGDAMQRLVPDEGNHAILCTDVVVVRDANGVINTTESYIMYMDQHGGFNANPKAGLNGLSVITSCNYSAKKSFADMFSQDYIPMACIEILDDTTPLAEHKAVDSRKVFDISTVTAGTLSTNYAFTKVEMVITNSNGQEVYRATRYSTEGSPRVFRFSDFASNAGDPQYASTFKADVYKDALDVNSLANGTYNCKATVYFSDGTSLVGRNFSFTK